MQNKELDQHFLKSKNTLLLETNLADINDKEIILEIGAGDGRLSEMILQKNPKKLISIEIDERYKKQLEDIKNKYNNFEIIFDNALDIISELKFDKIIANIPYNITEPLYRKILSLKPKKIIFLHGQSFYEQLLDENSKWFHFINSFYDLELIKEIPGNAFEPEAKIKSVLIELNLKEKLTDKDKFFQILFSKENRNCKNALLYTYVDLGLTKKEAKEKIKEIKITDKKLKDLSNKEFVEMINFFF